MNEDELAAVSTLDELRASTKAALSVADVARLLGLDGRTVRRACEDGQLPCLRVGVRRLIPREPLIALLSAPEPAPLPPSVELSKPPPPDPDVAALIMDWRPLTRDQVEKLAVLLRGD